MLRQALNPCHNPVRGSCAQSARARSRWVLKCETATTQTNGRVIRGQNAISHPGRGAAPQAAAVVDKHAAGPPMEAPIRRIFYLSSEGTHQARVTRSAWHIANEHGAQHDIYRAAASIVLHWRALQATDCTARLNRDLRAC